MEQREITAWTSLISGMMIAEIAGIFFRAVNIDKYSLWIVLAFYSIIIFRLAAEKDKLGEEHGN